MEATLPPGPRLPALLQGVLAFSQPERFLGACERRYGSMFTINLGRVGTYVYLTDPADIRSVFRGDTDVFRAGEANARILGALLGRSSVLVTDGPTHLRQRRLMMPAFHGDSVAAMTSTMAEIAARDIATWPVGRAFATRERFQAITLEVILRTVIGATEEDRLDELRRSLPPLVSLDLLDLMQFAFPRLRGLWPWKRFDAVEARANDALYSEIHHCRKDPELHRRNDVLAMLVRSRDESGEQLTDEELRDQLVTLLLAGHETTATGLAWAVERLVRHPSVLARAEQAARAGDDAYLDAVVTETLRARPVVPDVSRKLTAGTEIGGRMLPAGVMVDPAILLVHKSGANYERAEAFDPGRFVERPPAASIWLPFGGGNRRCLGASFALAEMRVILGEVLRRLDLATTTAPDEPAKVRHVTIVPRHGATVTVRRRAAAGGPPAPKRGR